MEAANLPSTAGPVPDRIAIWPLDDGRYGLDATFQGKSGFERAEAYEPLLKESGVRYSLLQELGDQWSLRFGPLTVSELDVALGAFVR
jgi:hypothetical protein